ncbi:MAG: flagellar biosynthetic protein FliR [Alphaproteobacteria bacterium]
MLERLVLVDVLTFFLVFCRVGSAVMLLPGFGESFVSPQVRLLLALAISLVVAPVVGPALAGSTDPIELLVATEIGVGLFIGAAARLMMSALHVAGSVIAFQTSLAGAMAFDPTSNAQTPITGTFLSTLGLVLIFTAELHHVMLAGLVESYGLFVPGALPPIGDFAEMATRIVADAFRIGLQLAAPFLLVGVTVTVGMGLLSRLMPQVQVFFLAVPAQVMVGLLVLALTLGFGMTWFLEGYDQALRGLLLEG